MSTGVSTRYLVLYAGMFVVIMWVFYALPSAWLEALTAQTSAWFLIMFGHTVTWTREGSWTILTLTGQRTVTVSIIRECTALNVYGVLMGLILPLKADLLRKAKGIILAGGLLFSLNIPRIALTVYLTAYDTWPFTLLVERSLETYHYPISFTFGVIGVAVTILAVSKLTTPELEKTLIGVADRVLRSK